MAVVLLINQRVQTPTKSGFKQCPLIFYSIWKRWRIGHPGYSGSGGGGVGGAGGNQPSGGVGGAGGVGMQFLQHLEILVSTIRLYKRTISKRWWT